MADTYTQLYIQIIFAVKGRKNQIHEKIRVQIEKYICGIITNKKSKPIAIYCNPDHIHILIGIHPSVSISDITRDIKSNSSRWINENKMITSFAWQKGYGAFSYSKSQLNNVVNYILNQPEHHKVKSFHTEYLELLKEYKVQYDDKYLFEWLE